ncbi:MAG TPA: arginine--tRNA ligase, partial [Gammaproteobacteria bacterium]|nr:arginine--tRNA ligase [Gammaproteobacteria bacterium]
DWGTQFGMLLTYLAESGEDSDELGDIENFYRAAKTRFDDDRAFQDRCRQAVVDLQSGDADAYRQWQRFI